jgi:hypothetical protein
MFTNVKYIYIFSLISQETWPKDVWEELASFCIYLHWTFSAGEHATVLMILKTEYNKLNTSK